MPSDFPAPTLKPCPFCGVTPVADGGDGLHWITCRNPDCFGPTTPLYGNAEDTAAAWNRRADRKARALSEGRRWRIATRSSYNGSWQFWPAEQWHGEAGRSYAEERFSLMPPSTGRLTMRANVYSDPFSGARVWYCTEEGSKEDGHDEEAVTLAANTFAIGTLLQIWEPDND